ncbi:MAG: hypothetical protein GX375_04690 [Clostridiales bacterium]|nr:hypothetical protein [Clostridiales bacterium]
MKSISVNLLEAALVEKEEYLEELKTIEGSIQEQIGNLQYEIDELLIRIYNSYKEEE